MSGNINDNKKHIKSSKPKKLRKPPASRQSERFEQLEQKALEIVGDDYWDWLEEKYVELYVNHSLGFDD